MLIHSIFLHKKTTTIWGQQTPFANCELEISMSRNDLILQQILSKIHKRQITAEAGHRGSIFIVNDIF